MFEPKYSKAQRAAVIQASCDRGVKPYRRVVELAAAGELLYTDGDGQESKLEPFKIPRDTVATMTQQEQRKRSGRLVSVVADQPPRDGLEAMRRRLVSVADREIARLEAAAATRKGADLEACRKAARLLREVAAIPGPGDPRPDQPGKGPVEERIGGETRSGLGAAILADHRGSGTAHDAPASPPPSADETGALAPSTSTDGEEQRSTSTTERENASSTTAPGSEPAQEIAALRQALAGGPAVA